MPKNIILTTMSTLPRNLTTNYYYTKDAQQASKLLEHSLIVMDVLEKARFSAGIRFGCDG